MQTNYISMAVTSTWGMFGNVMSSLSREYGGGQDENS